MNNLCYILGSGIMDNPDLFKGMCILVLSALFGWLAFMAYQKMEQSSKGIYPIAFAILVISTLVCFFFGIYTLSTLVPKEKHTPVIEKAEYENHEYLIFKQSSLSSSVIHNPDCPCRKKMWAK